MKILVFGALNIDMVFSVDHIAFPGETISSGSLLRSAGGKGANQAAALAKAGVPVYLAGKIGEDGKFLLDMLSSYGVNTEYVKIYGGATGRAFIQVDKNGQNSIILFSGGNGLVEKEEISAVLSKFNPGDIMVIQNEIVNTDFLIKAAKKRGLKICFNPSPYDKTVGQLPLDLIDILFVNEIEGAALAGLGADSPMPVILDTLTARFPKSEIVLTAGKDGAHYGSGAVRAKGEILDLPVVDTTGAGDTFTGYFLAARANHLPVEEALCLACKAASIAVSRKGAMEAIPYAPEVF